jgi:hypothetical protein
MSTAVELNEREFDLYRRILAATRETSESKAFQSLIAIASEVGLAHQFDDAKLNVAFVLSSTTTSSSADDADFILIPATVETSAFAFATLTKLVRDTPDVTKTIKLLLLRKAAIGLSAALGKPVDNAADVLREIVRDDADVKIDKIADCSQITPRHVNVAFEVLSEVTSAQFINPEQQTVKVIAGTSARRVFRVSVARRGDVSMSVVHFAQAAILSGIERLSSAAANTRVRCPRIDMTAGQIDLGIVVDAADSAAIDTVEQQLQTLITNACTVRSVTVACECVWRDAPLVTDVNWRANVGRIVPGVVAVTLPPSASVDSKLDIASELNAPESEVRCANYFLPQMRCASRQGTRRRQLR